MTENNPEYHEPETNDTSFREVLIRDRWRILIIGAAGVLLAAYFGYEPDITVPNWALIAGATFGLGSMLAWAPAGRLVDWLFTPGYRYLLDLDARDDGLAVWELPPTQWRELEVTKHELHSLNALLPAYAAKNYDPETNTCEGTWRGSATDVELLKDRQKVHEIRNTLEELAQEGLTMRVQQSGIIRNALRGIVTSFVGSFEKESVYDGEQIERAIDDAMAQWSRDDDDETDPNETTPGDDGTESEPNQTEPGDLLDAPQPTDD